MRWIEKWNPNGWLQVPAAVRASGAKTTKPRVEQHSLLQTSNTSTSRSKSGVLTQDVKDERCRVPIWKPTSGGVSRTGTREWARIIALSRMSVQGGAALVVVPLLCISFGRFQAGAETARQRRRQRHVLEVVLGQGTRQRHSSLSTMASDDGRTQRETVRMGDGAVQSIRASNGWGSSYVLLLVPSMARQARSGLGKAGQGAKRSPVRC